MKKSTLIKVGLVGAALVLFPRRSSKKADCTSGKKGCGCSAKDKTAKDNSGDTKVKGCDCKNCKCPLCRLGKCPLCAIGKCFCCKKSADTADKKADKAE